MTIEELLNSYFQRDAKVSEQLDTIERAEADMQPVPKLTISVPNYADEVIRPILKMVAEALPEYEITVPSSKQCKLVNGLFQIRTDKICLGGLSYMQMTVVSSAFKAYKHTSRYGLSRIRTN